MKKLTPVYLTICLLLFIGFSHVADAGRSGACTRTSNMMRLACKAESRDDFWVQKARCQNESEWAERRECIDDAKDELVEVLDFCHEQFDAREEVCDAVGQAPYDPEFEPEDFETSLDALTAPNPYYPMAVGNVWTYDGDEEIMVEVLDETKLIDDIVCFVVRDVVSEDGRLVEDTDDWFAIARADGAIWYCGEEVKDFEYFEGDEPSLPELVAIDGSFKVERDGDRAGIVFPGYPAVGETMRAEFSLGNAEDIVEVISTNYAYGQDEELDELVPQELAELLCNNNCVVVAEYTPIEPGVYERKYYAPGIGFFTGTNPEEGEVVFLTGCNFNSVCESLPESD
ncbi:MAG TPA: hypothetical protein PKK10_14995 [Woeseiaceae bacterium]|nr:hypothetical protein [Woeseiaceae bacterium]